MKDQESTRPKRMSLSEVLELVLTRSSGDRSTVALSRTASGEVVIDVKVSAETVEQAGEMAHAEYERLRELYPRTDEPSEPTVTLSRNAKGDTQIEFKGQGWEATEAGYDRARMKYPMANGLTARPGTVDLDAGKRDAA